MDRPMRRYPRIPARNTVLVTQLEGDPLDALGHTRTLGLGGCGFISQVPLGVGSTLEVLIATRPKAIRARARVVYELTEGSRGVEIGVEFLELDPEHRAQLERMVGGRLAGDGDGDG